MNEPRNPYAPPAAVVTDAEPAATERNPHVELACKLMWASLGLSLLDNVVAFFVEQSTAGRVGLAIGTVIGLALGSLVVAWFTRKLRAGRNWMRWLITALALLGWLSIALFWDFFRAAYAAMLQNPLIATSVGLQTLMGLASTLLLHTTAARAWFSAHAAAN